MAIMVGSARQDERRKYANGEAGDQLQKTATNDLAGEVGIEKLYVHSCGWYILRPKSVQHANAIATNMTMACNNYNIGYDQNNRLGIIKYGVNSKVKTECDCSSLVRQCVKEATGKDPGNFTTANEVTMLLNTGLFEDKISYISQSQTPVYNGDILVTKTKGHTVIVVSGNERSNTTSKIPVITPPKDVIKEVKATKSATHHNKKITGTYKTTSALNMRNGAGVSNKTMVVIPNGASVSNYGYYSNSLGTKWLYVQYMDTAKNIKYTGFCSEKYLERKSFNPTKSLA